MARARKAKDQTAERSRWETKEKENERARAALLKQRGQNVVVTCKTNMCEGVRVTPSKSEERKRSPRKDPCTNVSKKTISTMPSQYGFTHISCRGRARGERKAMYEDGARKRCVSPHTSRCTRSSSGGCTSAKPRATSSSRSSTRHTATDPLRPKGDKAPEQTLQAQH